MLLHWAIALVVVVDPGVGHDDGPANPQADARPIPRGLRRPGGWIAGGIAAFLASTAIRFATPGALACAHCDPARLRIALALNGVAFDAAALTSLGVGGYAYGVRDARGWRRGMPLPQDGASLSVGTLFLIGGLAGWIATMYESNPQSYGTAIGERASVAAAGIGAALMGYGLGWAKTPLLLTDLDVGRHAHLRLSPAIARRSAGISLRMTF